MQADGERYRSHGDVEDVVRNLEVQRPDCRRLEMPEDAQRQVEHAESEREGSCRRTAGPQRAGPERQDARQEVHAGVREIVDSFLYDLDDGATEALQDQEAGPVALLPLVTRGPRFEWTRRPPARWRRW